MATSAEQTFYAAVIAAENKRQNSKSAAFVTWAYSNVAATYSTYKSALSAADRTYYSELLTAAAAAPMNPDVIGFGGPSPAGNWSDIDPNT